MDISIDGVPLPSDALPASGVSAVAGFDPSLIGTWVGTWDGLMKHVLIIESVAKEGKARVVYAVGDNPLWQRKAAWLRYEAVLTGSTLKVLGKNFEVTYALTSSGKLRGEFGRGGYAILTKQSFSELSKTNGSVAWDGGETTFLATDFVEGGAAVELETVIFKPPGTGAFPLAVVNHGSTDDGTDQALFKETWTQAWLAEFLNERGWIVAFPQRRGRGRSGGLYDEGFAADRTQGYTCEADVSLAGADRALVDLNAAIAALGRRDDVEGDAPVLLVGQSRGGILSAAYAGMYPRRVHGVVNFVGGWLGEGCETAAVVNQALFKKAAAFPRPMLSIYGEDDAYYAMAHNRANFDAFRQAGGQGKFVEVKVAGENNGHFVMSVPPLWTDEVAGYLDTLK